MSEREHKDRVNARRTRVRGSDVEKMIVDHLALYHSTIEYRLLPRKLERMVAAGVLEFRIPYRVRIRAWLHRMETRIKGWFGKGKQDAGRKGGDDPGQKDPAPGEDGQGGA